MNKNINRPAPCTVYVNKNAKGDGDGKTAKTAVRTVSEATALLQNGGIVVVCGDVEINATENISSNGMLIITSVYDGCDYTDTASVKIAADVNLYTDTVFKNVVLEKASYDIHYICANGNKLVIAEGVFCRNNLATSYISIAGGAKNKYFEGDTDVTVKSGYFRNVFGGNVNGDFKGNATVTFLGGYIDHTLVGGNRNGNFAGNVTLNIGGDAVVAETEDGLGVIGGICGSDSLSSTFFGDIRINLYGSARINQNLWGATYHSTVTAVGNVYITLKDDAYVCHSIYAGGNGGILNGNTSVIMYNGQVGENLLSGCNTGTVNGDTYIEINGGQLNYFFTNYHSSFSKPAGTYNVGTGFSGGINGNTAVVVNGGDIYGNIYGGSIDSGFVSGNSTVTLTGGSIMSGVYADGKTTDSVTGTKTLNIDLSKGGTLALGLSANVNTIVGGGSLTLFPETTITADTFSGNIALSINGIAQAREYITAKEVVNATVSYTAQDNEKFISEGGKFGISTEGYHEKTKVVFKHLKGVEIHPRFNDVRNGDYIPADEKYVDSSVFYLAPGLYNFLVYHAKDDYKRKYIYITGKEAETVLDFTNYTPMKREGYEASHFYEHFEPFYEKYYNTNDIIGFKTPDTPYFTHNRYGKRYFTSNKEVYEYTKAKADSCSYAYTFDAFTSAGGATVPVVVFTKDNIPTNATLEDVAKTVTSQHSRDIIMITAIVHGEESSAGEGALAMIDEMCDEFGNSLLTDNIGAVVIIPRLNPDGCATFKRSSPYAPQTANRDYMALSTVETAATVRIFNLFAPSVLMDLHESPHHPVCSASRVVTDIYDLGFVTSASLNTGFADSNAAIHCDYKNRGMRAVEFITEAMKDVSEKGFRPYYFYSTGTSPTTFNGYSCLNGAIGMTIEIAGLHAGDSMYARRVFAQISAVKAVCNVVKKSGNAWASEIKAARNKIALSAQKFNVDTPIVLQTTYSRHNITSPSWNNPLASADTTMVKPDNVTRYHYRDIAIKYRSRPTAYVISAETEGIENVLSLLDKHAISYHLLKKETMLKLKQYDVRNNEIMLGAAKDIVFDNGAYIIPVDGYRANMIATLFEPDFSDNTKVTLVQMGHLSVTDIYRSEESFIAAKLGLNGTYIAVPTDGKTAVSATTDDI